MAEKQLILAVEGTAALGPFWGAIVSDYLEKIIRCFGGGELNGQKPSGNVEFALVVFYSHGSSSACLVQRSGWTKDVDAFLWWLSALPFTGGGFCEAAIAEGLGEALMMFSLGSNGNQNVDGHKQCILIAASNPYPLPTPVYRPKIANSEQNGTAEVSTENCLSDAEMVAKFFAQCPVSLSVFSPKQLPKLRAIYNVSKRNPQSSDPPVDNLKNPHFLVLISENFMEARSALSRSGIAVLGPNQVPVKVDSSSVPPVSGPPATSIPSVNGSMMNRQSVPGANIPTATVKVEPTTVTSMGPAAYPHLPSVSHGKPQGAPTLQTSSPSSTSQDVIANGDNAQEFKPMVNGTSQPLRPVGPAAANVSILNNLSQARQVMSSASLTGATSMGLQSMGGNPMAMHMSNMISSGMSSSALPAGPNVYSSGPSGIPSVTGSASLVGTAQVAQNAPHGSFSSATSNIAGNSNLSTSQPLAGLQGSAGMGQSVPVMSQGNHSVTQMGQNGIGMNQTMMNGLGASNVTSGGGTMIPTPGMSQQVQSGSLPQGPQQTSNPLQAQAKYLKVWEGALSGQRQGQPVFITKLEGYRNASASDTLAADWPPMMQIVRLISQDHMNNKQYVGKADFLVFRALNQHGFLAQLQEKKLCAVIQLPSQTLLLSVSDKASRLIGMLFPGDMVVFKPQVPNQSQQLQQQQQQQQQQHPQLQQQQHPQLQQQQQSLQQLQQQHPQLQQQQLQQLQSQQLQQQPQQHHQQQMVGTGMAQAYMQGAGRSQLMNQGTMSAQGPSSMPGTGFLT